MCAEATKIKSSLVKLARKGRNYRELRFSRQSTLRGLRGSTEGILFLCEGPIAEFLRGSSTLYEVKLPSTKVRLGRMLGEFCSSVRRGNFRCTPGILESRRRAGKFQLVKRLPYDSNSLHRARVNISPDAPSCSYVSRWDSGAPFGVPMPTKKILVWDFYVFWVASRSE